MRSKKRRDKYIFFVLIVFVLSFIFLYFLYQRALRYKNNAVNSSQINIFQGVEDFKTERGIRGMIFEKKDTNLISFTIAIKGGAGLDGYFDKYGLSNVYANMLGLESNKYSYQKLKFLLNKYSIKINAYSTRDTIFIQFQTLDYYKEEAFDILSSIIKNPKFSTNQLQSTKLQVLSSLKMSKEGVEYYANKTLYENMFGKDNKSWHLSSGDEKSIVSITSADLYNYHKNILNIDNIFVGVSGNISKYDASNYLDSIFSGANKRSKIDKYIKYHDLKFNNKKVLSFNFTNSKQALIYFVFKAPKFYDDEYLGMLILSEMLGGGLALNNILMKELREKKGLTYGVSSSIVYTEYGSYFIIWLKTDSVNTTKVVKSINNILRNFRFRTEYFVDIKSWLVNLSSSYFISTSSLSSALANFAHLGLKIEDVQKRQEKILNVSSQEIRKILDNTAQNAQIFIFR